MQSEWSVAARRHPLPYLSGLRILPSSNNMSSARAATPFDIMECEGATKMSPLRVATGPRTLAQMPK